MAKELRNHLTAAHGDKYDVKTALQAVKNHLMKQDLDQGFQGSETVVIVQN